MSSDWLGGAKNVPRGEIQLWKYLKDISPDDHLWTLKTWDKDGAPIVMAHYNKNRVSNLFSNFTKSHLKIIDRYEIGANTEA